MKTIRVALVVICASSASLAPAISMAQSRPSTTSMSCSAASALVATRHAIVLGTGRDTYERFVSDQSQCLSGQMIKPGFAPAADNAQCLIGWRCYNESMNDK